MCQLIKISTKQLSNYTAAVMAACSADDFDGNVTHQHTNLRKSIVFDFQS